MTRKRRKSMARDRVTISLPGSLLTDVEELITKTQYSTVSEYIRELIRKDLRERDAKILAVLESRERLRIDKLKVMNHLQ